MLPNEKQIKQTESNRLISRSEMVILARQHNVFVTKSTIHRWSEEESDFPLVTGIDGRSLLYSRAEFIAFLKQRIRRVQEGR